jgi:glucose/arabinose dehydrogenase
MKRSRIQSVALLAAIFLLAGCDSSALPAPPTATNGSNAANPSPTVAAAAPTATSPAAADTPTTVVVTPTAAPAQATATDTVSPPTATHTSQPTAVAPSAQSTQLQPAAVTVPQQYSGFEPGSEINLPPGFSISVFAAGLRTPRMMAIAPNGDLFVANMGAGQIVALPDRNQDGVADSVSVFADSLDNPHSLAFHNGYLYVATDSKVVRYPYANGDLKASAAAALVTDAIPAGSDHHSRTITFGPDGRLYIAAGSTCNVCVESDPRYAAISVFDMSADGSTATNRRTFASGLRNAVGIEFAPGTNQLWAVVNGRDNLGDNLPPEILVQVKDGADYGWPYCYGDRVYDTDFGQKDPSYCQQVALPDLEMQAHSAPLGLDFYSGKQFPADFQGNLFIGFHGSWNRSVATGYKLVRVPFVNGKPQPAIDFATGWLAGGRWGRPVDPLTTPDGSLFLSDDAAGVVYHISYKG